MYARRIVTIVVTVLAIAALTFTTVMAQAPHFIFARASIDSKGSLVVSWKEAGLGDNQNIEYLASADANGFYACINGGEKHPQAVNKEAFTGQISSTSEFNSGENGQITASLTTGPPPSSLECPPGQKHVLACVTYSNIALNDTTNELPPPPVSPASLSETIASGDCPVF